MMDTLNMKRDYLSRMLVNLRETPAMYDGLTVGETVSVDLGSSQPKPTESIIPCPYCSQLQTYGPNACNYCGGPLA
jgi:hypothetical protein